MSYKSRTLFSIIQDVNHSLYLPHIQRPFVWDEDQMCKLFDSLMRNYPIQTFLFWRTKDPIKARKFMHSVERDVDLHTYYDTAVSAEGVEKVFVLDGQQRLQTLYSLFSGALRSPDGTTDLEAYVDITGGVIPTDDTILFPIRYHAQHQRPPLPLYRLRDLLTVHHQRNAEEISDEVNDALDATLTEEEADRKARQKRVRRNCGQLVSLLREDKHFWVQELDGVANDYSYKRVLDILVRVNSGGTRLDTADLMFAAMKEGWAEVEERIEDVVDLLNESKLEFDKTLVLKCIVVAYGLGAELRSEKFTSSQGEKLLDAIETHWDEIEATFQQLRDFIVTELKLYGAKMVRSYGSFVPLFDYLYHNPQPNEANRVLMCGYYYKSQLVNWYGRQTDGVINVMHGYVGKPSPGPFPLVTIADYFRSRNADTALELKHLEDMRLRYIILNLIYVARFGVAPFNVKFKGNDPHIDHIYPQSPLRNRFGLATSEINSIGNYRFVGATDNIRKRAELPSDYFTRLKAAGVDIEKHLLLADVAHDPTKLLFTADGYADFRQRRLQAIFDVARKVVNPEIP